MDNNLLDVMDPDFMTLNKLMVKLSINHSPKLARPMIATVNDANDENTTMALPENVVPSG